MGRSERRRAGERGFVLLSAFLIAFLAAMFGLLMANIGMSTHRRGTIRQFQTQSRSRAEGAIEAAKNAIQEAAANWRAIPTEGTVTIDGLSVPYRIAPTGFATVVTDASGLRTVLEGYEIESFASVQGYPVRGHRIVNLEATPLFQFVAFYAGDLEILPGPNMTLAGRVHTNGDLYLSAGNTLRFDTNYLRAAGRIHRSRKDNPGVSSGQVDVRRWVADPFDPSEPSVFAPLLRPQDLPVPPGSGPPAGTPLPTWLQQIWDADALDRWSPPPGYAGGFGNTVLTGAHGIGEALPPSPAAVRMFEPVAAGDFAWNSFLDRFVPVAPGTGTHAMGFYHAQADLRILTFDDGTWTATDGSGADVTASLAGVVSTTLLYDARQADGSSGRVAVTDVDLAALAATGRFPSNGLLYAARYGAGTGTAASGIRLKNGAELAGALTVVSENPVYVSGDYNTIAKKPAAVIGDAVNLLSNAWDDTKSPGGPLPLAASTQYNAALVLGNLETSPGSYNGGLENFPRFHENWSGRTCTIVGALVQLWPSVYATGRWVYGGNRYHAPRRNWSFDLGFHDVGSLPPFTPRVVTVRDVVSW